MSLACHLIVDSCCDLPAAIVNREGVTLIKFPYLFNEEQFEDDLWRSEDPKSFYNRMRKGEQPTTSQASILSLTSAFTAAAIEGVPSVYLCFASALSSSYDQACMVADQIRANYPDFELHVVDTCLASTGEALFIFEALRQQELGLTAAQLKEWAEEARNYINVYFMVEDLETLRRGGRLPSSVAIIGSKLDVKPVLTIPADGSLAVKGVARGRKKALKMLAEQFAERGEISESLPYVCVGNADAEKDMKRLEDLINKDIDKSREKAKKSKNGSIVTRPVFIEGQIGPVIGSHVGPGMVSIAFWGPDKREEVSLADRIASKVRK